jgi:hypothetical protein
MMKFTCDRKLGDEEKKILVTSAKLMNLLELNEDWVGFGMLYRTTAQDEFHFVDQKYE